MRTAVLLGLLYVGDCVLRTVGMIDPSYSERTVSILGYVVLFCICFDVIDFVMNIIKVAKQ